MSAYSAKAQPYLDAIAASAFADVAVRDWLIAGCRHEQAYRGATILNDEQRNVRWKNKPTKQPFWANYWCGKDTSCTCRIAGSKCIESDAIFFIRNELGRGLALHLEFKHRAEAFQFGQPEAYPMRAACFTRTHPSRKTMNAHHDWITILFCDVSTLDDPRIGHFDRVITHDEAKERILGWPV